MFQQLTLLWTGGWRGWWQAKGLSDDFPPRLKISRRQSTDPPSFYQMLEQCSYHGHSLLFSACMVCSTRVLFPMDFWFMVYNFWIFHYIFARFARQRSGNYSSTTIPVNNFAISGLNIENTLFSNPQFSTLILVCEFSFLMKPYQFLTPAAFNAIANYAEYSFTALKRITKRIINIAWEKWQNFLIFLLKPIESGLFF